MRPSLLALATVLLSAPAGAQRRAPQRDVDDPGVIATGQRVTPAGVQTVLAGRVHAVRFAGGNGAELWVTVPGAAYRLDWRANRVLARVPFDGRPGIQGLAIDPATGNALVSTIGRLPPGTTESRLPGDPPLASTTAIARLGAVARDASGDSVARTFVSGALGDYMAGAPAVAARPGADGRRVAVLPLPANDALAVVDADRGTAIRTVPLGVVPIAAALSADGAVAWVTNFGGARPSATERAALQCCDPRAERVRVDARGLAAPGSVSRVDVARGTVRQTIAVGRHASGLAWDEARGRLYVADGNADAVSVVDTRANVLAGTIAIAPFRERKIGLAPTAVALAPDGLTLYVALGGANAVAIYDVREGPARATLRGLVPTGWYPASLDVSADGRHLAVGTLLGVGSGAGETSGERGRYVHAVRGSVNVIEVPSAPQLGAYTAAVAENSRLTLASLPNAPAPARATVARAVPEHPGDPSLIEHVVFVIRENRTYDQVLGDLGRGDGDSSLVQYGRDVTPNTHALSERFVTLDHFFASGGNSADGHQWLTQANETSYPMWPLYYGRSYPFEGSDPLVYSSGGFLWESAQAKGRTVSVFGEYAPNVDDMHADVRASLLERWRTDSARGPGLFRDLMRARYRTRSPIPSLDRALVREYPGWTHDVPDVVKAQVVLAHLREWEARKAMPHLVMIVLPSDHTVGTRAGWCTPKACVADNDLALGQLVEGLSHSSFWKSMAILVVEDDAQNGVDHVDGHRTVALAISPYARRGAVDSTFYAHPSMVKTIELMLGLPAMSLFDLVAPDMRASFLGPDERPDYTPYTALAPAQSLFDKNLRVGAITGPFAAERRRAALASARMRFDEPDAAPSDALNRILWHDAKGWGTAFPGVKQSVFFPMSVELADDEREAKAEKGGRKNRR
jgi:DNA-binding beta-propeller fold protein YncE